MTTVGCTCVVSLEVLLGPEAGKTTPWADLGSTHPTGVIAIGRSKKFVFGKGPQGDNRAGLLLSADLDVSSRHAQVVLDYTMGVLCARQEHVNACLDETSSKSKKSRRRIPASADKHQMELAVALSRSVVGEEIECMLTRGMMEREIADIDAAIAKLQKKRESLVRKLQKNAKEIKRFAPSSILPPEVVVQWDVQAVLADMFPPSRRLEPRSNEPNAKELSHDDGEHQRERDRPSKVCKRGAVSALWQHAAATSEDNVVVPSFARYIMSTAFPVEDVPIEVKVIFPEWKENLMFLQSSTAASLDAALACLRAEMAKLQPSQYDTDAAKYKAFSYFELRMEALLDAKSNHRLNAQTLSGGGEGPSNLPHEQQNR
ncbi:hypothetical protein DYB32_009356 [Aphanomyces invadans]|uniref:FHA domain-containing protein n=1 Tax=Aphanomyces invadans TaxID=157072 RepID=A0A418AIF6_9STRA|nr:hypothetical protein DYB32_009356 [Aphanomyces invadans]